MVKELYSKPELCVEEFAAEEKITNGSINVDNDLDIDNIYP